MNKKEAIQAIGEALKECPYIYLKGVTKGFSVSFVRDRETYEGYFTEGIITTLITVFKLTVKDVNHIITTEAELEKIIGDSYITRTNHNMDIFEKEIT